MRNNRSLVIHAPAGRPRLESASEPIPQAHEVVVRIEACALNFADLLMCKGQYQANPPFPLTPGLEVSGTIDTLGDDVKGVETGDRVVALVDSGGLSDFVAVPADRVFRLPETIKFESAAAFPMAYGTSHLALLKRGRIEPGETLIVLGAAGGVGLTAIEIGKMSGAKVIAVARGKKRLEHCEEVGADVLIDTETTSDLRRTLLDHGRADVLYDAVGGAAGSAAQRVLRPEGRHILIGFASGELPQLKPNHLLVKNLDVLGVNWNYYVKKAPTVVQATLKELIQMMVDGHLTPRIGATYALADAAEALDRLKGRDVTGKIVVKP